MIVQDRSQSNFLKDESHIQKPTDVIIQENRRYVPFFIGGHQGYYTDLQPIPGYDAIEVVLEFLCILALVLKWVFYGQLYVDLSDVVPLLFNSKGEVTASGDKLILFALPILGTFFFVLLTILQLITNRFQYDLQITPENAREVFQTTRKLILVMKLITMGLFIFLSIGSIRVIQGHINGYLMAYCVIAILLYGLAYYIYSLQMGEI